MYRRKCSRELVKVDLPPLEDESIEFMNRLTDLYSQYESKAINKSKNTKED